MSKKPSKILKKIEGIPTNYLLLFVVLVISILGTAVYSLKTDNKQKPSSSLSTTNKNLSYKYDPNIPINAKTIMNNDNALYSYVKKYGLKKTAEQLAGIPGDCHNVAHRAGRIGYILFGTEAFRLSGAQCHSGEYHGATEEFFKDHGTANLQKNLRILCNSELNSFFSHQCVHGIGHGLMAWTNYDLPAALKDCDLLNQRQDSCYTGVFMENIVGGLATEDGHFTKYLSNDAQFPCNVVDNKYKASCYFLQTSRMAQLFNADYSKVARACSEAPEQYRTFCFQSMGRDIGGSNRNDPQGSIVDCKYAPYGNNRIDCVNGAVQDAFWDPSGQDISISFCKLLTDSLEKASCYNTIIGRAPDVLLSKKDLLNFCSKLEIPFATKCNLVIE